MKKKKQVFLSLSILLMLLTACQPFGKTPVPPTVIAKPSLIPTATTTAAAEQPSLFSTEPAPTNTIEPTETSEPSLDRLPYADDYSWVEILSGFTRPVDMEDSGDGKIYVVEQEGQILFFENGVLLPQPFLDIRDRVGSRANEQGLLGLALDPNFLGNRIYYLNYTNKQGDTVNAG